MTPKKSLPLSLENRVYHITPDFGLVCEVERELGGIAALQKSLAAANWEAGDLVALIQILLQAAGKTVDYMWLGNLMLAHGLEHYRHAAEIFLNMVMYAE